MRRGDALLFRASAGRLRFENAPRPRRGSCRLSVGVGWLACAATANYGLVVFTGIVEELGRICDVRMGPKGATFLIESTFADLSLGDSVAVHGTCLTVEELDGGRFSASASLETLRLTTLSSLHRGDSVHLERAVRMDTRLGGHLMTGHVDGMGEVSHFAPLGDAWQMKIRVPAPLLPFLAAKGSVSIDGVSLTANTVDVSGVGLVLVPYTLDATCFRRYRPGMRVNVEVDILSKYVASQLGKPGIDGRALDLSLASLGHRTAPTSLSR